MNHDKKKKRTPEDVVNAPPYQPFGTFYRRLDKHGLTRTDRAIADSLASYGATTNIKRAVGPRALEKHEAGRYEALNDRLIKYRSQRTFGVIAHELAHDVQAQLTGASRGGFTVTDLRDVPGQGEEFWANVERMNREKYEALPEERRAKIEAAKAALEALRNFEAAPLDRYPGQERIADSLGAAFMTMFSRNKQPVSDEMLAAARQALLTLKAQRGLE